MKNLSNNILLVEDNVIIAFDQKIQLEKRGYSVIHIVNGEKAVEFVKTTEHDIDLILMDIDLGKGIDGTQATREILEIKEIPVVFLSSHTEPEIVGRTETITSYGYVVKNSGITVLDTSIKMAFKLFDANKDILKHKADAEKTTKALQKTVDNLNFLSTISQEQAETHNLNELIQLIIKQLLNLTNAVFVTFSEYNSKEKLLKNMKVSADQAVLNLGIKVVGKKILETEVPVDDLYYKNITTERIQVFPSLYEDTNGAISLKVSTALHKTFNLSNIWGLSYAINDTLFGASVFALKKGQEAPDKKVLNSFINITSISIRRLILEQKLRDQVQSLKNVNDIYTQLSAKENRIRIMQDMLDNYEEAIWTVDKDFKYTFINSYFARDYKNAFGIELKTGMNNFDIKQPELIEFWKPKYELALKGERTSFEFIENALRDKRYFQVNLNPIYTNSNITGVSAISVDITRQKLAEIKALEEISKSQKYLDIAGVMFIAINKDSIITLVNKKLCESTEYTEEELVGENWFIKMIPERLQSEIIPVSKKLLAGEIEPVEYYENPILTKSGKEIIVAWHNTILKDEKGNITGHLSSGNDITEQLIMETKIKENEELLRTVTDYTNDWEYWISNKNKYFFISPSVETITGYKPEEFYNIPGLYEKLIYPEDRGIFLNHKGIHLKEREPIDFRILTKDNEIKWISHICREIFDKNGSSMGIRGSNRDITLRKGVDAKVKKLLTEKELILQEVHHRIKNNMATLISLISLQTNTVSGKEAQNALLEIENRIRTMMVLYDTLYRSTDFQSTSTKLYLSALLDNIIGNFPESNKITVTKNISNFQVDAKTIFNLGIIINELITNSMKYAFKGRSTGEIILSANIKSNNIVIVLEDNGIGLPGDIDLTNNPGFGMKLIMMLVEQMEGSINIERKNGTKFTIIINLEQR